MIYCMTLEIMMLMKLCLLVCMVASFLSGFRGDGRREWCKEVFVAALDRSLLVLQCKKRQSEMMRLTPLFFYSSALMLKGCIL